MDLKSVDLYSARCALLHTLTGESNKTKRGKATKVYYDAYSDDNLNKEIDGGEKIIRVEDLIDAFKKSIAGLLYDLYKNPELEIDVCDRAASWFIFFNNL